MKKLNFQLKELCLRNRDGSHATQSNRHNGLQLIANELDRAGFRHMGAASLKEKHVVVLVNKWMADDLNTGTIKNRMAHIRWWASKVGKHQIVKRPNEYFHIPDRAISTGISKAKNVDEATLRRVTDQYIRLSLELQKAFGLRREEAIKFIPRYADRGDRIVLKASWTKGGKERSIPVDSPAQRQVLERAARLVGGGSMIPPEKTYIQQLRLYERLTHKVGLSRMHGLRHRYAQQRYQALTGWNCPAAGGPAQAQLSRAERLKDKAARLQISRELGHERIAIVSLYIN